jgi:hypothetical protein
MVTLEGGGHPDTTDLSVALFNETGEYVTGVDEWFIDGQYDIQDESSRSQAEPITSLP